MISSSLNVGINKNSIIIQFLLFSMNSERYNERLHQIKEKYGRTNHKNPEETFRQKSYKRETTPLQSQRQNYKHTNYQQMLLKPLKKEVRLENQHDYRRQKQNFCTSPLSLLKNSSPIKKSYKEDQAKRFQGAMTYQKEFFQSQRPSICKNYLNKNISPRHNYQNNEQSSPIRKLQTEFDNQNTPRYISKQIKNFTERTPPATPSKSNLSNNHYTPLNLAPSPLSKTNQNQSWRQNEGTSRIPDRPPEISKVNEPSTIIPRKGQQFQHQFQNINTKVQKEAKPTYSINSINSIQERIQMALKANKK